MLRDDNAKVHFLVMPEIYVTPGLMMEIKSGLQQHSN